MPAVRLVQRDVERQAVDRLEHDLPGDGQLVADLRPFVELASQSDRLVVEILGFLAQRLDRHRRMVGLFLRTRNWTR